MNDLATDPETGSEIGIRTLTTVQPTFEASVGAFRLPGVEVPA